MDMMSAKASDTSGSSLRIQVVEDDPDSSKMLLKVLDA
jgi:hypothetical protein